jgi:hypothetical protein
MNSTTPRSLNQLDPISNNFDVGNNKVRNFLAKKFYDEYEV